MQCHVTWPQLLVQEKVSMVREVGELTSALAVELAGKPHSLSHQCSLKPSLQPHIMPLPLFTLIIMVHIIWLLTPCLTSRRVRHKKCDEEKPACQNCRKTGRICDGYLRDAAYEAPSLLYSKVIAQSRVPIADSRSDILKTYVPLSCISRRANCH